MRRENKSLNYFELKLQRFLTDYHPDKLNDKDFITARLEGAMKVYEEALMNGSSDLEAEHLSSEVLYGDLNFSPYEMIETIIEEEFPTEVKEEDISSLALILLDKSSIKDLFNKYNITDSSEQENEYRLLYTELTGEIAILIDEQNLLDELS